METVREECCCFTGHRPEKLDMTEQEIRLLLDKQIERLIQRGYTTFFTGMASGFDLYAAEAIVEKMSQYPKLRLIGASPYRGFENHHGKDGERYRRLIPKMEQVIYVHEHYSRFCYQSRNQWMVDRSSVVLAAYNGSRGGTRNTVLYANRTGVEVVWLTNA